MIISMSRVTVLYHSYPHVNLIESADSSKIHSHFHCLFEGSLDDITLHECFCFIEFLKLGGEK